MSADENTVYVFKAKFENLDASYTKDQIFTADEIELNFRFLMKKSVSKWIISTSGHKIRKERIIIPVCNKG